MQLTAIVTCKDREKNLNMCLNSILECSPTPHILVVDFGSERPVKRPEKIITVVRIDRNIKLFHKARALNIGIKLAKTPFICITDADQVFNKNFFGVVENVLIKDTKAFVMCFTYFLFNPSGVNLSNYSEVLLKAKKQTKKITGDGCCNGLHRKYALKLGGYDESYLGYGGEDSDFALRASFLGLHRRWIHSQTNMVHLPHEKRGAYYSKEYYNKNRARYFAKKDKKVEIVANQGKKWGLL